MPRRIVRRPIPAPVQPGEVHLHTGDDLYLSSYFRKMPAHTRELRGGDYLHVSDLLHKCMRKKALMKQANMLAGVQTLTFSDEVTFAQGEAIHDLVKMKAALANPEEVWGGWSCKCGACYHEPCTLAETDLEERCPHCYGPINVYQEVPAHNREYMIVGNPDLLFKRKRAGAIYVTEIKSMAGGQFKELTRPVPDHVLQVLFYWFLMRANGHTMVDQCSIFYVNKEWSFGGSKSHKEFVIHPELELHRLEPYLEDALAYKNRASGVLPSRAWCPTIKSPKAKKCEVRDLCFA